MKVLFRFLHHFYHSALKKEKRDWEIISYCILLASMFWFLNAMGKTYHYNIEVPVHYNFNSKRFVPLESMPEFVEVRAEGHGWDLLRAIWAKSPSKLEINITKPLETFALFPGKWQGSMKEMMPSVKLEAVLSDSIYCRFDPIETVEIPLFADLTNLSVKSGYRISSTVKITPNSVRFTGAASLIRKLPPQLPLKISGQNVQESFDQNIALDFQDEYPKNQLLHYGPENVNVHFSIRSALEDEMQVPIVLINSDKNPNLILKENKILINYLVAQNDRQNVQATGFRVVADVATFNPADSTVEILIKKQPAIVSDVQPSSRKIRVYGR